MSSIVLPPSSSEPPPFPVRRFSVAEYEELTRLGILTEYDTVELLEGWIVPKMPKYPPHDGTIDLLNLLLTRILPLGWYPRVQNSVVTDDSVPEPDLVVARGSPDDYLDRHPRGTDVGLIIEVADSTVQRDRRKARIYARAGVPVYWIVNLGQRHIEIYSQPGGDGLSREYQSRQDVRGEQSLDVVLDETRVASVLVRDIIREPRQR